MHFNKYPLFIYRLRGNIYVFQSKKERKGMLKKIGNLTIDHFKFSKSIINLLF